MDSQVKKVIRVKIYQPFACYREPLIMSYFITSLPLPPPTTVVGMIATALDTERTDDLLDSIKTSIVGKGRSYFIDYQRLTKPEDGLKKLAVIDTEPKPARFQVHTDMKIILYLSSDDNQLLLRRLIAPLGYLTLGRKEDFVIIKECKEIDVSEYKNVKIEEAIERNLLLSNTYIPFDENLQIGYMYNLPARYHENRDLDIKPFLYIGEYTEYIEGTFLYDNEEGVTFRWMT